jgi:urease accessory protein
VGHAANVQNLPLALTAQMYLQAFMSNLVICATRLVPLGQTDGQRLIRDLTPLCQRIATDAMGAKLDALSSTAFLSDIASMKHETQYSRMFRT